MTAAGLLLFAWAWPSEEAAVPAGKKAALLAQCRDALEVRLGVELDPAVHVLPSVTTAAGGRYLLTATVTVDSQPQSFSCEVVEDAGSASVEGIRLLDW